MQNGGDLSLCLRSTASSGILRKVYEATPAFNPRQRSPPAAGGSAISAAASRVTGIDAIFGGHTHDGVPTPTVVVNAGGKTLVTNAGSNGKFLGVMDFDVKDGKVADFRYKLLPIFSNLIQVGDVLFRMTPRYDTPPIVSAAVLVAIIATSAYVLSRRIRAVEVVT